MKLLMKLYSIPPVILSMAHMMVCFLSVVLIAVQNLILNHFAAKNYVMLATI